MWILPKQLHISVYAPDTRALALDSEAFSQLCEKSLTWRGKDSLSRTWLQRWKRESWMQHLCSRTLKPSHTESFVDSWTSFPEDSRVSHSQLLESVKLLKTPDTSSPTSQTELESANLELFSLKTYKESSAARQPTESQFSSMSSEHWKDWVIEQRQEYSQRKKSAHLTKESESTSLAWPTASVAGCVEGGVAKNVEMTSSGFKATRENGTSYGAKLRDAVETHEKNWATPQTFDSNNLVRTPEKPAQTRAEKNAGCMNLREQVHYPDMDHSRKAAKNWPTPTAVNRVRDGETMEKCLKFRQSNGQTSVPLYLEEKVMKEKKNWPTVTVGEEKYRIKGNSQASKCLSAMAVRGELGHPDQANPNTIGKSQGLQSKLNPNWVEHLMGLPAGWTDLGYWETE